MQLYHPNESVQASTVSSSRVVANVGVPMPTTLQKGKAILEDLTDSMNQPIMKKQTNMRSNTTLPDGWHWRQPNPGQFKLNVDASWSMSNSSYEGLVRDHQGRMRIAFTRVMHPPSPEYDETVTVRDGLRLSMFWLY